MRLATWNVNSIRARQGLVVDWLADQVPDVCCLQETKCNDATFPAAAFESLGYEVGHQAPPERAALQALLDLGFHDLAREHAPHERQFTWWNYRGVLENDRGLRLDLVGGSRAVRGRLAGVAVDRLARAGPGPSDHAPVVVELRP